MCQVVVCEDQYSHYHIVVFVFERSARKDARIVPFPSRQGFSLLLEILPRRIAVPIRQGHTVVVLRVIPSSSWTREFRLFLVLTVDKVPHRFGHGRFTLVTYPES
jgi:hypothetical protein